MKVLHYITIFSSPSETFVYDQIKNLEEVGVDNYILTQKRELGQERPFKDNKLFIIKERKRFFWRRILYRIFYWKRYNFKDPEIFLEVIRRVNPDLIHAHFGTNGVFMKKLLEKNNLRIPLVISFHGTDATSTPILDPTYKKEIENLDSYKELTCTAQTEFLKGKMEKEGVPKEKISIINNAFNKEFIKNKKKILFKPGDVFKVINIARFINWKGHRYLLEAFQKLINRHYSQAELTLIGDGENRAEMEGLAKDLGIRDRVNFLGSVEHKKIPEILTGHHVYVQASIIDEDTHQQESFGIAIIEAIAAGLPGVASNTGGMPEAIIEEDREFSFLVPQKDSEAIYKIFKKMTSRDYKFKDNTDYAQKVIEKFSPERQVNSTIKVYKNLINKDK